MRIVNDSVGSIFAAIILTHSLAGCDGEQLDGLETGGSGSGASEGGWKPSRLGGESNDSQKSSPIHDEGAGPRVEGAVDDSPTTTPCGGGIGVAFDTPVGGQIIICSEPDGGLAISEGVPIGIEPVERDPEEVCEVAGLLRMLPDQAQVPAGLIEAACPDEPTRTAVSNAPYRESVAARVTAVDERWLDYRSKPSSLHGDSLATHERAVASSCSSASTFVSNYCTRPIGVGLHWDTSPNGGVFNKKNDVCGTHGSSGGNKVLHWPSHPAERDAGCKHAPVWCGSGSTTWVQLTGSSQMGENGNVSDFTTISCNGTTDMVTSYWSNGQWVPFVDVTIPSGWSWRTIYTYWPNDRDIRFRADRNGSAYLRYAGYHLDLLK